MIVLFLCLCPSIYFVVRLSLLSVFFWVSFDLFLLLGCLSSFFLFFLSFLFLSFFFFYLSVFFLVVVVVVVVVVIVVCLACLLVSFSISFIYSSPIACLSVGFCPSVRPSF